VRAEARAAAVVVALVVPRSESTAASSSSRGVSRRKLESFLELLVLFQELVVAFLGIFQPKSQGSYLLRLRLHLPSRHFRAGLQHLEEEGGW